jgi:hypothetical protein
MASARGGTLGAQARADQGLAASTEAQIGTNDQQMLAAVQRQKTALEEQVEGSKIRGWDTVKGHAVGDLLIQSIHEGYLWAINYYGHKNEGGWLDRNGDWLQVAPQIVLGGLWYAVEVYASRNKVPKPFKQAKIEAARLLMNLGFSNLGRLLRSRWFEKHRNSANVSVALREQLAKNAELTRELTEMKGRIDALGKTRS